MSNGNRRRASLIDGARRAFSRSRGVSGLVLATALLLSAGAAVAQEGEPTQRGNRMAYDWAMKCFVADGHAEGMRQRAGDTAKAAYYDEKAHQAFDKAVKLGALLGFSGDRVSADFDLAQTRELPRMVADQQYFLETAATCKALGLM